MKQFSLPSIKDRNTLLKTKRFCSNLQLLVLNASSGIPGQYNERAISFIERLPELLENASLEDIMELRRCRDFIKGQNHEIYAKLDSVIEGVK